MKSIMYSDGNELVVETRRELSDVELVTMQEAISEAGRIEALQQGAIERFSILGYELFVAAEDPVDGVEVDPV